MRYKALLVLAGEEMKLAPKPIYIFFNELKCFILLNEIRL